MIRFANLSFRYLYSIGKNAEILTEMNQIQQTITKQKDDIKQLTQKVKLKQNINNTKNKQLHQLRIKLTERVEYAQNYWQNIKQKCQQNKQQSIRIFAKDLINMSIILKQAIQQQKESHSLDLKEGFQMTTRLFFNTLQKYQIKPMDFKIGDKITKQQQKLCKIIKQDKTDNNQQKGAISQILKQGWLVSGVCIMPSEIAIYL